MRIKEKSEKINLWVSPKEKEEFELLAEKYGLTLSALIRFLVRRELNKLNE